MVGAPGASIGGNSSPAVSVASGTQTLSSSVAGLCMATGTAQVSQADLWHLGSNVKAMTAALAGVMVQRGQITWDTTIGHVFPDLTDGQPGYALGCEVQVVDGHLVSFHEGPAGTFVAEVSIDSQ